MNFIAIMMKLIPSLKGMIRMKMVDFNFRIFRMHLCRKQSIMQIWLVRDQVGSLRSREEQAGFILVNRLDKCFSKF